VGYDNLRLAWWRNGRIRRSMAHLIHATGCIQVQDQANSYRDAYQSQTPQTEISVVGPQSKRDDRNRCRISDDGRPPLPDVVRNSSSHPLRLACAPARSALRAAHVVALRSARRGGLTLPPRHDAVLTSGMPSAPWLHASGTMRRPIWSGPAQKPILFRKVTGGRQRRYNDSARDAAGSASRPSVRQRSNQRGRWGAGAPWSRW
jgi:hypothetical protein